MTISKRLGHAKPDITLRVYAHLFRKDDSKASDAINAALAGLGRVVIDARVAIGWQNFGLPTLSPPPLISTDNSKNGWVAERLKAKVLKTGRRATLPRGSKSNPIRQI